MSLIIFHKEPQVSFQRFGVSIIAGSTLLMAFGLLHSLIHRDKLHMIFGTMVDWRLLGLALGLVALLVLLYLRNGWHRFELDEVADAPVPLELVMEHGRELSNCRSLVWQFAGVNCALLLAGLYQLVLSPLQLHRLDMITMVSSIAVGTIAVLWPVNYAMRLRLQDCLERLPATLRPFALARFRKLLYWLLILYWACIFGSYLLFLAYTQPYCKLLIC